MRTDTGGDQHYSKDERHNMIKKEREMETLSISSVHKVTVNLHRNLKEKRIY